MNRETLQTQVKVARCPYVKIFCHFVYFAFSAYFTQTHLDVEIHCDITWWGDENREAAGHFLRMNHVAFTLEYKFF
jgi:hypothetical protein